MNGLLGIGILIGVVLVFGIGRNLWKKKIVRRIFVMLIAVIIPFIGIVNIIIGEAGVVMLCMSFLCGFGGGYVLFFEDELKKKGLMW